MQGIELCRSPLSHALANASSIAQIGGIRLLGSRLTESPRPPSIPIVDQSRNDPRLLALLEEIEREETPERLFKLATQLQEQLLLNRQRRNPE
jgi:hypothetical protein